MRKIQILFLSFFAILLTNSVLGQKNYSYETVPNDPLHARIYTLDNGLKVFLTDYKEAPRVQCYIAVKVGSKNDPHETTGLAHYFEHMMFKGTPNLGTTDWASESVMIDRIEQLFEIYRVTIEQNKRDSLYHLIDSISYQAAKLAIPNEYDKVMKFIGSQGTNAGTSNDYTIYIENVPSNQLENWAIVQADRFEHPVLRLFHTELETVYEEKNMSLTNDSRRANEEMMKALYPNHPYGQQTTLGKPEHLKNPSMKNIREFYSRYYVPNNMAICISGDIDFDKTITIIDNYFGRLVSKPVPQLNWKPETPITQPIELSVVGLEAEFLRMAYRIDQPANSKEIYILNMVDRILSNGKAGLIDLNLNQKQLVDGASAYSYVLCDNSSLYLYGKPKNGQTLKEVRDLLLEQIEILKSGNFDESLLQSAIDNMRLSEMRSLENNSTRARLFSNAFVNNIPWSEAAVSIDNYSKITKEDVVRFANKYLNNNYVVVYKNQGTPEEIAKVSKPTITPLPMNRDSESDFFKMIKNNKVPLIAPDFADVNTSITFTKVKKCDLMYLKNEENKTFNLQFRYKIGELNDLRLPIAAELFDFLGTSQYSAEQIMQQYYNLACNVNVSCGDDYTVITLSGLSDNFVPALSLTMNLLTDAQPDENAIKDLIERMLKKRVDAKSNQNAVMNALRSYVEYGEELVKYQLSENELKELEAKELIALVKEMLELKPDIYYYGTETPKNLVKLLAKNYPFPASFLSTPTPRTFDPKPVTENCVYFVPYNAKQAKVMSYFRGPKFDLSLLPIINIYNQYFGGSMNAIVFQELREKRSLAYTAQSRYISANELDKYMYNYSYIATQNDKVYDALTAFEELFNQIPTSEPAFNLAKDGALSALATNRTLKTALFGLYRSSLKMGINYNINKVIFEALKQFTMQDVVNFNANYIKEQPKFYMIMGREKEIDLPTIEKNFGKVIKLSLDDVFGY